MRQEATLQRRLGVQLRGDVVPQDDRVEMGLLALGVDELQHVQLLFEVPSIWGGNGRRNRSSRGLGSVWSCASRRWLTLIRLAPGLADNGDQNHPHDNCCQPLPRVSSPAAATAAISPIVAER